MRVLFYSCGVLWCFLCFMERPKCSTSAAMVACAMPKLSPAETLLCRKIVQQESILQHIRELSPKKGRNKVKTNVNACCRHRRKPLLAREDTELALLMKQPLDLGGAHATRQVLRSNLGLTR